MNDNNHLKIDLNRYNFIKIDSREYFILIMPEEVPILVKAQCPHRGGPLNLGALKKICGKFAIECPWHQNTFQLNKLIAKEYDIKKISNNQIILKLSEHDKLDSIVLMKKNILLNFDNTNTMEI